jgi:hypothetical protein
MILFLCSCSQKTEYQNFDSSFKEQMNLEAQVLNHSDTLFANPTKIYVNRNLVYLLDPDHKYHLSIYNLSNQSLMRILPKGRAENEFVDLCRFQLIKGNVLCFLDDISAKYYEYTVSNVSELKQSYEKDVRINKGKILNYAKLNKFGLATGVFRNKGRFLIHNRVGANDTLIGNYPNDRVKIDDFIKGMAYQSHFEIDDSRDLIVSYCTSGDLIFFSAKDSLLKIKQFTPIFPKYKKGAMISTTHYSNSIVGFLDVSITKKYVYCLYSGRTFGEYKSDAYLGRIIYKFDHYGKPIGKYNLDKAIRCLNVTSDDKLIYAITLTPHANLVIYENF